MTDEQLHVRMINKRMIIVAFLLLMISAGLGYYYYSTGSDVVNYAAQKSKEAGLQSRVEALESANAQLRATIDQTGRQLVSFSEDKIRYINLASEMATEHSVEIDKLTVSDVWDEGSMAGMTTTIEVEGTLSAIKEFINGYCGLNNTNRINVMSCRPVGRFPWLSRTIDNELVLDWMDLTYEQSLYVDLLRSERREMTEAATEAGIPVADLELDGAQPEIPITLDQMFGDQDFKIYLVVDFLGRQ